jgi:hypothetical protein
VTVVCVHNVSNRLSLTSDGSEILAINERPGDRQVLRILQRSAKIGHAFWFYHFTEQKVPPAWRDVPLLRSCRLAIFQDGALTVSGRTLRLDPLFGLSAIGAKEEK